MAEKGGTRDLRHRKRVRKAKGGLKGEVVG